MQVLGWNKEKQYGSIVGTFETSPRARPSPTSSTTRGADMIMPVAGPVGAGTLASAKEGEDR